MSGPQGRWLMSAIADGEGRDYDEATHVRSEREVRVVMTVLTGMLIPILVLNGGMALGQATGPSSQEPLRVAAQDARPYESVTESKRLFDPEAVKTVRGVVMEIETVPMEHETPFMQLTLKADHDIVHVHVAPQDGLAFHDLWRSPHLHLAPDIEFQTLNAPA